MPPHELLSASTTESDITQEFWARSLLPLGFDDRDDLILRAAPGVAPGDERLGGIPPPLSPETKSPELFNNLRMILSGRGLAAGPQVSTL